MLYVNDLDIEVSYCKAGNSERTEKKMTYSWLQYIRMNFDSQDITSLSQT